MGLASSLLKASHIGIRELKGHITTKFLRQLLVITNHGMPVSVNLPYSDLLGLTDILDELADPETTAIVAEGRAAIKKGSKGVGGVSRLFKRIRKGRK